jgi:hypothetical protein
MHRHPLVSRIFIITIVFASMYVLAQQQGRLMANDMPQLLATQTAKQLDAGLGLTSIQMGGTDLANDPVPFVIVYDKKGRAVAGSGYLGKKLAVMPTGVVNHAKSGAPHAVTWAPRSDIRIATVTVAAKEYYVVGGQSLKMTEAHAKRLLLLTALGYGASLFVTVAVRFCRCRKCNMMRLQGPMGTCECHAVHQPDPAATPASVKKPAKSTKPRSAKAAK